MPFLLDGSPTESEIADSINYLLANFNSSITADPNTGQITGPTGEIAGYLYQYMLIKYADSFDGTLNFSNSPTNKLYYGIRNNNDPTESSNPADYIWFRATGGFGTTKYLWYICTGGRQIQFAISVNAPDTGWLEDPGVAIDLDVVTSGDIPVIAESFFSYFTPSVLQVPRTGDPLTPSFTAITPTLYATDRGTVVSFTDAQTDSNVAFVNNTWRIGNSATTGYGDISYTNITIGSPTDGGDYAVWPNPTAMASSPAYITVPVRYKNSLGVVAQSGVATLQLLFVDQGVNGEPGATGPAGPSIDISGFTGFVQNAAGAYTPPNATLSAVTTNITSPTYNWAISGATPTSSTASSIVISPTSSAVEVEVTLTVNGSNLLSPLSRTITLPIIYDGAAGEAGQNGVMSAFPSIYIWTGSATPPARPTTTSTYTWGTGDYSAPSGWSTEAPSNTVAGNYLWSITIPLNVSATTVTSTLDWTNVANQIRAIAYNGDDGSAGSATFLVTRFANDGSPPTDAETIAAIGRTPVAGDIVTVSYNNANNAIVYRYTTSWINQATYITGSLIVQNTITGDKMVANTITGDKISGNTITGDKIFANTITADKLSVTNLSAISADLGTITAGSISGTTLSVGTTPTLSGTTMTGSGAKINSNGTFALGDSATNITYNGTILTLNGNVIATNNINTNAVTIPVSALSTAGLSVSGDGLWHDLQEITYSSTGNPVLVTYSFNFLATGANSADSVSLRIVFNSTEIYTTNCSLGENIPLSATTLHTDAATGSRTYKVQMIINDAIGSMTVYNRVLSSLEAKR